MIKDHWSESNMSLSVYGKVVVVGMSKQYHMRQNNSDHKKHLLLTDYHLFGYFYYLFCSANTYCILPRLGELTNRNWRLTVSHQH